MDAEGADLLARAAAGDRGAFDAFVRRWERPLGRFLLRVTGSPHLADDARQATFVRVLTRAGTFRGGGVATWLFRTALRIAIDQRRADVRRAAEPVDAAGLRDAAPGPSETAAAADEREHVRRALARLGAEERALLWLRVAEEMPFAAVAEAVGLPESTARLRFVRALGRLRRELGAQVLL
jgi:RNA polymerase sigma-70 factor, ECF subfamily